MTFKKGHAVSQEIRDKISSTLKGGNSTSFKRGHKNGVGKVFTAERKEKIRQSRLGEKNWRWKGGISSEYKRKHAPRPQSDSCEICYKLSKTVYEHSHATGKFRGWVCQNCNTAMGMVGDNIEILENIIKYLNNNK